MIVNRGYVWASVTLVAVLLIFFWWASESAPEPEEVKSDSVSEKRSQPIREEPQPRRNVHEEECASCPEIPIRSREAVKRSGLSQEEQDQIMTQALYEYAEQVGGCDGLLLKAALDGEPSPNTFFHGGCEGRTPLHMAMTVEQVENLIEAGADVNARDDFGRTPLHTQSVISDPTADNLAIIEMLLEAGADPKAENEEFRVYAPWKHVRVRSSVSSSHLSRYNRALEKAESQGLSMDEFLDANPREKAKLDAFLPMYLVEAQIKRTLLEAAVGREYVASTKERMEKER